MSKIELKNKKKTPEKTKNKDDEKTQTLSLTGETKHGIISVFFSVVSVFLVLSYYDMAGVVGKYTYQILGKLFGTGYALFPISSLLLSFAFIKAMRPKIVSVTLAGGMLFLLSSLALTDLIFKERTAGEITGGSIGSLVALPFLKLFDGTLSIILLGAITIISTLIIFESRITLEPSLFGKKLWGNVPIEEDETDGELNEEEDEAIEETVKAIEGKNVDDKKTTPKGQVDKNDTPIIAKVEKKQKSIGDKIENFLDSVVSSPRTRGKFTPPPLTLFEKDSGKPGVGDIKANANIIKRTLFNFGIDVEMDEISIGPSITRYALKPAEGIKLSRIITLQNDLSMALAAHPLRIEAPIPGKSLVGIEIPNKTKSIVGLASLFGTTTFQDSPHALYLAMGRGVSGIPYYTNLAKAPHMLIAGTTGSGKSVTIHTIVTSLLYRNPPDKLRFIMIDPKRVELTLYKGIQHLLTEVITDPKKAILALKWATKEMERRYNVLEQATVKDIQSYHKTIEPILNAADNSEDGEVEKDSLPESMPYIVIIIDELADIMTAFPRELEASIVRLAQMSRAVGIHLILSTQRPSTEVITGLIKANIPTRVALQVPSQIDSRTIIDMPGAEKLLGAGDMLFIGSENSKAVRIQSGYVTETEIKNLVKFIRDRHQDDLPSEINFTEAKDDDNLASEDFGGEDSDIDGNEDNQIYNEAKKVVVTNQKASSSFLQRKLKLGYARAARIMDLLEERGIIGPGEGSKPREVYIKADGIDDRGAIGSLVKEYNEKEIAENEVEGGDIVSEEENDLTKTEESTEDDSNKDLL
ncbi:MAG: DNA translocase FtsK [bacterium]